MLAFALKLDRTSGPVGRFRELLGQNPILRLGLYLAAATRWIIDTLVDR